MCHPCPSALKDHGHKTGTFPVAEISIITFFLSLSLYLFHYIGTDSKSVSLTASSLPFSFVSLLQFSSFTIFPSLTMSPNLTVSPSPLYVPLTPVPSPSLPLSPLCHGPLSRLLSSLPLSFSYHLPERNMLPSFYLLSLFPSLFPTNYLPLPLPLSFSPNRSLICVSVCLSPLALLQ